ncbi:dynein regulatory complex subunit 7 [Bombina bombina]|uniref:dynein regulatory complex subunit 7 n=1 Tax=Bombina bombina TaxID=8345 RepID=UPI00235AA8D3|nr:dynein regulatory complex subunit 7 [Bombina bombina]
MDGDREEDQNFEEEEENEQEEEIEQEDENEQEEENEQDEDEYPLSEEQENNEFTSDEVRDVLYLLSTGFPESYKTNSHKEEMLLTLTENFWRQYTHLYPDRRHLFMSPQNECGVQKFVCTTLRPTLLPYPELYHWDQCAQFVAEYLSMKPLHPPLNLPAVLYSSSTILNLQKGNCFDFSILLCSLLLGAGYDAYCVSGYATREMCLVDETREVCPLLTGTEENSLEPSPKTTKKYSVKPPRQLISTFEQQQKEKQEAKFQAALHKEREEKEQILAEAEKPGPDPLYGLRVHCWVLVLSGKREVPENFFIDALTGKSYGTKNDHFLGIESLWNHKNYWVNMQDCRNACKDLSFDLGDPVCWEFMLLDNSKPLLLIPDMEEEEEEETNEGVDQGSEKIFHMPPSWVLPILVTQKEFETRCPEGKKVKQYRKAKMEKWGPYLQKNGQVSRLTEYQDIECTKEVQIQHWFQHRMDKLDKRQQKIQDGVTTESFSPGRGDALKVHVYRSLAPETERSMTFYSEARLDGLHIRDENPKEMTEIFQGRSDFLKYKHIQFGKRPKKVAIAGGPNEANPRPILKITERFLRNKNKPANEDVAERIFLITEDRIQLRCHRENDHITTSYWEYLKPTNLGEKGTHVVLTPETCISYQVEPSEKFNKQLYVYETLISLQQEEQKSKNLVRKSEAEVLAILSARVQEEADPKLTISIYDTERNEKSKAQRDAQEHAMQEERKRQAILEMDYLAPFLAQLGEPEKLTRLQAQQVKEECLKDLKQRLIEKANLMQARFEKETQELEKKQQWYQQSHSSMNKEDEESYLEYCSEAMFRIEILKKRLSRHKALAPQKYLTLEERLNKDPRLCESFLAP